MNYSTGDNRNTIRFLVCMVFLISPLLSLPLVLTEIWNKQRYANYLLILFFCTAASLFPPTGDLYRYYDLYYKNFADIQFIDIFNFYIFDFIWYIILFILSKYDISFQYSLFISCFIQLNITLYILQKTGLHSLVNSKYFCIIIGSMIIHGFWITIELRFYLALAFFILGIFKHFEYSRVLSASLLVLSGLTHLSFFVFIIIFYTYLCLKKYINLSTCIIFGIVVILVITSIGYYLESLGFYKAVYITQATDWTSEHSFLLRLFRNVLVYTPGIYLLIIIFTHKTRSDLKKLSLIFITVLCTTFQFGDFNSRIKAVCVSILWLIFALNLQNWKVIQFKRLFLFAVFAFIISSSIYNKSLRIASAKNLFQPWLITLYNADYSDSWIQYHFNDGNVIQ